jgi:putative ABC transport system permease protein
LTDLATAGRRLRRGRVLSAVLALLAAPWHFLTAFRVFISRGPLLLALSYPLYSTGVANKDAFPFSLGISLGLVGAALLVRWIMAGLGVPERLRNRIGYTLAGLTLVIFWLLPFDFFRSDLNVNINMFFLSGMMLMLGGIWTVMYNVDLLLGAALRVLGGLGRLAPVVKTAVTYPLQQRFRTGMTLFMFSLVIFSLMVQAVLIGSFGSQGLNLNAGAGGYQVWGNVSTSNPIHGVNARIAADPTLRGRITAAGGVGELGVTLRQTGPKGTDSTDDTAAIGDDSYLASTRYPLHIRAMGYTTDAQVWLAVRTHPGYAVVRSNLVTVGSQSGFIKGITYDTKGFTPVQLQMEDMRSGTLIPITIIGVIDDAGAPSLGTGADVFTSQGTLVAAHDAPVPADLYFFRVAPGHDVHQAALALGSSFLPNGLDVKEAQAVYDQNRSMEVGFNNMLEGFMALGLVVGIAALGVIATRSVVERRQQIGMLRALGFQRSMIRNSFLMESGFVAVTGTLIGTVLGLLLGHQVVTYFAKTDPGLTVSIPWVQVGLIVVGAYAASLLTTYLPARQASRIFPAEALRYE